MTAPLFTDEGPQYYSAAFRHNVRFAQPGPYMTKLNPQQENSFRGWVSSNHVKFNVSEPVSDYDMRGFWLSQQSGGEPVGREPDGSIGYPDTYKTPYDTTFSRMSKYATPDCPYDWHGNQLVDTRSGALIFDRGGAEGKQAGGQPTGARIWRGANGFDEGGPIVGGSSSGTEVIDPVLQSEISSGPGGSAEAASSLDIDPDAGKLKWTGPELQRPGMGGDLEYNADMRWASKGMYDEAREAIREGVRLAQIEGYSVTPEDVSKYAVRWERQGIVPPPEIQRIIDQTYGKEFAARAARSKPTTRFLYRGMQLTQAQLSELLSKTELSMPLSSFTPVKGEAKNFASQQGDSAWFQSEAVPEDANTGVIIKLEKGAKVANLLKQQEFAAFGQFEVTNVKPATKNSPAEITLRQKSMLEHPDTPIGRPPPMMDDLIKESLKGINERGGITIDLKTGHQPSEGYGFAPSKDTELMFKEGVITPEDVNAYIESHFEALQKEGMHFGAWVSDEDKSVYLDVSKVGEANAETLRAAMEAEQLGIWDFGAPPEIGELRIGSIDDATGIYTPAGDPAEVHAQHQRDIQALVEKSSVPTEIKDPLLDILNEASPNDVDAILDLLGPDPAESSRTPRVLPDPIEGVPQGWESYYKDVIATPDTSENAHLWMSPDQLEPYAEYSRSPESPNYQALRKAIEEHGSIRRPIILDHDGTNALITEGNHRLAIAKELGIDQVPVRVRQSEAIPRNDLELGNQPSPMSDDLKSLIIGDDEKLTEPTTLEPEPGPRVWKDGKSYKVGKDGPGKGGPGAARAPQKASVPELLGKAGKVLGPTLSAANDIFMAYGLVDQAAQQGIADQVAKGNVVKKGPDVLGIPTGTAFSDPAFKNGQSFTNRSPADLQYWLKTGRWPEQDKPQVRSGPTLPANPGMQSGGQMGNLKLRNSFQIRHADGSVTQHTMSQVGPQGYRADGKIKLQPGDKIELNTHHD